MAEADFNPIREDELRTLESRYAASSAAADVQRLVAEIRRLRGVAPAENLAEFMRRSPLTEAVAAGEFELPERSNEPERDLEL